MFPAFASVMVAVGGSGSKSLKEALLVYRGKADRLVVSFGLGVIQGLSSEIGKGKAACTQLCLVWTVRDRGKPIIRPQSALR
jgi:hypothetical protein